MSYEPHAQAVQQRKTALLENALKLPAIFFSGANFQLFRNVILDVARGVALNPV